jgi:hypothetical protein
MRPLFISLLLFPASVIAQQPYADLPTGKYAVGFRIVKLIDENRLSGPPTDYLGNKQEVGPREIIVHIWYPAQPSSGEKMTVAEYAHTTVMTSANENLTDQQKAAQWETVKASFIRFFGQAPDDAWTRLAATKMMGVKDARPASEKFPLLVGTLRPFSTTVTNELMASNGYVVAMIHGSNRGTFAQAALQQVPDLQLTMAWAAKNMSVDPERMGAYGFSGSGFIPFMISMHDPRIRAVADLESALFGIDARDADYWNAAKLRVPFMHIYNRELAKRDTHFSEFHRMRFAKRYHVQLNQTNWHHWNIATEGYLSCVVVRNRGEQQDNIRNSFVVGNIYLLHFFNAELKNDAASNSFLAAKPVLKDIPNQLWDIDAYPAARPAPDASEFESLVRTIGVNAAVKILKETVPGDSASALRNGGNLNGMGYMFLSEKKIKEAIGIFEFNVEMHPEDTNFIDSLVEGYEIDGQTEKVKELSKRILAILAAKPTLSEPEKGLKGNAERRLAK